MDLTPGKLAELSQYWQQNHDFIQYNHRLLNIYEGQLKKYLEEAIVDEFEDEQQIKELKQRVPTLNILRSLVDKLAKVYVQPVVRRTKSRYQKRLDALIQSLDLDSTMCSVDELLNLHKACFIEFFTDAGEAHIRAVPIDRALPYSSNPVNPLREDAVLKLVGREVLDPAEGSHTDRDGKLLAQDQEPVEILMVYTDSFITVISASGDPLNQNIMKKYFPTAMLTQNEHGVYGVENEFGEIPLVYFNRSKYSLLPKPDNDLYDMTILLPKLLADLNYTVKYQASSMVLAIDLDLASGTKKRPNSVIKLETTQGASSQGKFEIVKPEVDIGPVLSLVQAQLIMWLESRGLKSGSAGKASEQRASSLAKIIDSADATAQRLGMIKLLIPFEKRLIKKIVSCYNTSMANGMIEEPLILPGDLSVTAIEYSDQRPMLSNTDAQKKAEMLWTQGLATAEQTIKILNPGWSDTMVQEWVAKLSNDPMRNLNAIKTAISSNNEPDQGQDPKRRNDDANRRNGQTNDSPENSG